MSNIDMYNWQDRCYQFLIHKGLNSSTANHQVFNFVRDNSDKDFHFDVDKRVTKEQLSNVLVMLSNYYDDKGLEVYEYEDTFKE